MVAIRWDDLEFDDLDDDDLWWAALAAEPPSVNWPGILEQAAVARPRWQTQAACRGAGVDFFDHAQADAALALCSACPVAAQCATYAKGERYGVWAGLPRRWLREPRERGRQWCSDCAELTLIYARGMCETCYSRGRRQARAG